MDPPFLPPWKIFLRINEMFLIKHLGEKHCIDHWHLDNATVSCCETGADIKTPYAHILPFGLCLCCVGSSLHPGPCVTSVDSPIIQPTIASTSWGEREQTEHCPQKTRGLGGQWASKEGNGAQ